MSGQPDLDAVLRCNGEQLLDLGALVNRRTIGIATGQLYAGASRGAVTGVGTIGSGIPTSRSNSIPQIAAGQGAASNYDFHFADANTLDTTGDNNSSTGVGGLQRDTGSGSTRAFQSTLKPGVGSAGFRSVAGSIAGGVATIEVISTDENFKP